MGALISSSGGKTRCWPWCGRELTKVDVMSVSFDPELGDVIRDSAKRSGRGLSGWLAEAAAEKLRRDAFDDFLVSWESKHGAITPPNARTRDGVSVCCLLHKRDQILTSDRSGIMVLVQIPMTNGRDRRLLG